MIEQRKSVYFTMGCFVHAMLAFIVGVGAQACKKNTSSQATVSDSSQALEPAPAPVYATDIALGSKHFCTVKFDSTVACAGSNTYGQLGDGTTVGRSFTAAVKIISSVKSISSSDSHVCAVLYNNGVACWGKNDQGQLGDGTTKDSSIPIVVMGLNNVTRLALGASHSCALLEDQTVHCWGSNSHGQLGTGSKDLQGLTPGVAILNNVSDIRSQLNHNCALINSGGVKCWGDNSNGQLGDGTNLKRSVPVDVINLRPAESIGVGAAHSCAVMQDNGVYCWGSNEFQQLGMSNTTAQSNLALAVGGVANARDLFLGSNHSCALMKDLTTKCWGDHSQGQFLAVMSANDRPVLATPTPVNNIIRETSFGNDTCVIHMNNQVACWGPSITNTSSQQ